MRRLSSVSAKDSDTFGLRVVGGELRSIDSDAEKVFTIDGNDIVAVKAGELSSESRVGQRRDVVLTVENFQMESKLTVQLLQNGKVIGSPVAFAIRKPSR